MKTLVMCKIRILAALCAVCVAFIGCDEDLPSPVDQVLPEYSTIVKGTVSIGPGVYQDYPFCPTATMKNVFVVGSFEIISGGHIFVLVFDENNFQKWANIETSGIWTYYNSGPVERGDINVELWQPGAAYHLVLSNRHEMLLRSISVTVNVGFSNQSQ